MAINTDAERAVLYREFCEWCYTVPHLGLDPRLHTHSGRIEDGGYISNGVTAKAFAAWQAARHATAAPKPQADPQPSVPSGMCLVNAGALQMVINALRRDAEEGRVVRGEMADELLATVGQPLRQMRWMPSVTAG